MAESSVTRATCHELAALAHLRLDDAQAERFAAQIEAILHYVEQLRAVDLTNVPEYVAPEPVHVSLREDVPGPALSSGEVERQAPSARGGLVVVPKFKED